MLGRAGSTQIVSISKGHTDKNKTKQETKIKQTNKKPRARVKGVGWHNAQGLRALVFFYPLSDFVFKAWKTNSSKGEASAGCIMERGSVGRESKELEGDPGQEVTAQRQAGATVGQQPGRLRKACSGDLGSQQSSWGTFRLTAPQNDAQCVFPNPSATASQRLTLWQRTWGLICDTSQGPFATPGQGHSCKLCQTLCPLWAQTILPTCVPKKTDENTFHWQLHALDVPLSPRSCRGWVWALLCSSLVPTCHTRTKEAAEITERDTHTLLFSHLEIKGSYVF